ncbi:TonB-dependent receptor domain-containing protein [Phenylobacterium sp.]|uniref:TonB-dependent receptor domain-containing protein n=1 Tax=Phenylobacterium sp. TaxID=1871053 RepID=UPI0035B21506
MFHSPAAAPLAVLALLAAAPQTAHAAEAPVAFDIAAGPLDKALEHYSRQSGRPLLYAAGTVKGLRAPALKGRLDPDEALRRLIAGSQLVVDRTARGSIVLRPAGAPRSAAELPTAPIALQAGPDAGSESGQDEGGEDEAARTEGAAGEIAEVVVTGSHLRGVKDGPSAVVVLDAGELARRGFATLDESLASLPQNFGGGGTPTSLLAGADGLGTNSLAASGVNLRGLGSDATLVLVNGRRMAGTGSKGDFADLSAIPMVAVERVEVLLDGASALYGSDAVGGVVNIRLRKDFDGAETRLRYGIASGGEAQETQASQAFGRTWSSGRALIAYERYRREALPAAARDFAASADLRAFGGQDRRILYGAPGNVVRLDAATSTYVPIYAIRPGAAAAATTAAQFAAGAVNLENPRRDVDLLPQDRRDSLYGYVAQSLTPTLEIEADVRYTRRDFRFRSLPATGVLTIRPNNPHYVALPGLAAQQIAYGYGADLGPVISAGYAESLGSSLGATAELAGDWRLAAYGAFAQEVGTRRYSNTLNTRFLNEALGTTPDDPATAYSPARDGYFNPYGAGAANSRAVLDFIGSGFTQTTNRSRVATVSLQADGTLFAAPGGPARLAVGLQWRKETFDQKSLAFTSTLTPRAAGKPPSQREVAAAFAELRLPLVGEANARPLLRRLELSLAGRVERYDDVGAAADPKLGLIWKPTEDLSLRASYGASFRAPTLVEVTEAGSIGASFLQRGTARTLSVIRYGGNRDLEPETATSWSAGLDYAPSRWPGLRLELNWFDTQFKQRIGRPALEHVNTALTDPAFAPFVRFVDPTSAADLAEVAALIGDPSFAFPGAFPAQAYGAIIDARYVNTAATHVSGLDLSGVYRFDRGQDRFTAALSATWITAFEQTLTPVSAAVSTLDRAGEPVDLRARASLDWRRGAWGAGLTLNYVDGYDDGAGGRVAPWTSLDLQGRWVSAAGAGPLNGLSLSLSVRNLFDADPPFYDSPQGVGFDAANAGPLGRVISLTLAKVW